MDKSKNFAKLNGLSVQEVLQNYMFERFLRLFCFSTVQLSYRQLFPTDRWAQLLLPFYPFTFLPFIVPFYLFTLLPLY